MDDLIKFLRERLDEDEATAKAANPAPWRRFIDKAHLSPDAIFGGRYPGDEEKLRNVASIEYSWKRDENAAHIIRHDPARVLADVAAKRAIVDHLEYELADHGADNPYWYDGRLEPMLLMLAQPFADHPSFRAEWRLGAGTTSPGE